MSEMLKEVATFHSEMKNQARKNDDALPAGAAPVEPQAPVEDPPAEATPAAEMAAETPAAEEAPAPKVEAPETVIRIGGRTFSSQEEAIRYAEQLEQEKLIAEAHALGVREALQHTQPQTPPPPEPSLEDEFYQNPGETLKKIKEQAKSEALGVIEAERRRETLWRTFEEKYPDIERRDAELILSQNMDTIGKMTDVDKAMEALARRTRSEYQRIVERYKPRTELAPSKGQAVVPSSNAPRGVTPSKKEEPVLTMAQQLKKMREQKRNLPA